MSSVVCLEESLNRSSNWGCGKEDKLFSDYDYMFKFSDF